MFQRLTHGNGGRLLTALFAAVLLSLLTGCDQSGASEGETVSTATTETTTAAPVSRTTSSAASTAAQPTANNVAAKTPTGAGPVISFDKTTHDFGSIWDIEEQSHMFTFTNTGDETLIIDENVKTSCGCTAAKPDKFEYAPGESGSIGISFKPKGTGRQAKTITVKSNAVNRPSVTLTIQSDISQFVTVDPHILQFEDVKLGERHTRVVKLTSVDPNFEVIGIQPRHPNLSARLLDLGAGPKPNDGQGGEAVAPKLIEITLDENARWGQLFGAVNVQTRGQLRPGEDPVDHEVTITVNATVYNNVIVEPPLLQVGLVKPGDSFNKSCELISRTGEPFNITSLELMGSTVPGMHVDSVPINEPGKQGHIIIISGTSGDYVGRVGGIVRVQTDLPGDESFDLRVAGMIRDSIPY